MIEREALKFLVDLGKSEAGIIEAQNGDLYKVGEMEKIQEPVLAATKLNTLSSIVDYIKTGTDNCLEEELIINVTSPTSVEVTGFPGCDMRRNKYIVCEAIVPGNFRYENFYDVENFNILLQSVFAPTHDRELLLKVTGLVKEENVKTTGDDGVGQAVTVKTGVATVGDVKVPNPVTLKPYRTFQEVEQPETKFIFRMKDGPRSALFEADGGLWRNKAIENIKDYLKENLKEIGAKYNIRIIG